MPETEMPDDYEPRFIVEIGQTQKSKIYLQKVGSIFEFIANLRLDIMGLCHVIVWISRPESWTSGNPLEHFDDLQLAWKDFEPREDFESSDEAHGL